MFFKSLEIQGFKSFPDPTVIRFEEGITAVVGPNGSGKSNIADAVRWVMGEQSTKSLRGSKMEDVIFIGTKTRKAVGFAQVSMVLDNAQRKLSVDADEVTVTRRYFKSGESEYLINREPVRLKDIHELLMDTGLGRDGYSIIGQGKIAEILSAKSEERRQIFEEAAGISKTRYRQSEAEKRLAATETNLIRLRDIASELSERVEPLREQSEKAKAYLSLMEEKKEIEIDIWMRELDKITENTESLNNSVISAKREYEDSCARVNAIIAETDRIYTEMQSAAAAAEEAREEARGRETAAAAAESEASALKSEAGYKRDMWDRLLGDRDRLLDGGGELQGEAEKRQSALAEKRGEITRTDGELAGLTAEAETLAALLAEAEKKLAALRGEHEAVRAGLDKSRLLAGSSEALKAELARAGEEAEASAAARRAELEKIAAELKQGGLDLEDCRLKIGQNRNICAGYGQKLAARAEKAAELAEKRDALQRETDRLKHRRELLADLEKGYEGYYGSVKTVMNEAARGGLGGIHGPVSRLIDVEIKYALAVETALGAAMQNIICENEHNAKNAIEFLKRTDGGRVTFLPMTSIRPSRLGEDISGEQGFEGVASETVKCDAKYADIVSNLLGRTVIADNLSNAIAISKKYGARFKLVTLDGQVMHAGGSMTGGSAQNTGGMLSRKSEIGRLGEEIDRLGAELRETARLAAKASAEADQARAGLKEAEELLQAALQEQVRHETRLEALRSNAQSAEKAIADSDAALLEVRNRLLDTDGEGERLRLAVEAGAKRLLELEALTGAALTEKSGFDERRERLGLKTTEIRMERLALQKECDGLEASLAELRERLREAELQQSRRLAEMEEISAQAAEMLEKSAAKTAEAASFRDAAARLGAKAREASALREEKERRYNGLRHSEREETERRELLNRELERVTGRRDAARLEYDRLTAQLWDEYGLTVSEAEGLRGGPRKREGERRERPERRLGEVKNALKALGSVNVDAIEEYKHVKERHDFLAGQISDMTDAKQKLEAVIGDLEEQMKKVFAEKFEAINREFRTVFTELFSGGTSELLLTDPKNPLESGIEIRVEPPGKIIRNLSSLSGGEQAFVAIALYFAILRTHPTPFCLMDEIESALDDINVRRFAEYLRTFSGGTQFILITHRRGTMEEADMLYGVTMQEQGVSKLLALKVSEIEGLTAN